MRGNYRRNLLGRPSGSDLLRQAESVWRELEPELVNLEVETIDGVPTLTMQAHPAVEPLEMTIPSGGVVEVSANTSTGGPGYHRRMSDDVQAIGERLGVAWQASNDDDVLDETGYFEGGDRDAVDAAMLAWLGALLRSLDVREDRRIAIAMPVGYRAAVMDQENVITAMGPRDREWIARGAADPARAADIFAWWGDERDATHYVNRAVARMWVDVRWSEPVDDDSRNLLVGVDRDLRTAFDLDPTLELPWREWSEIRRLIREPGDSASDLDRVISEHASGVDPATRLIGYRRGSMPVMVFPGWTITMPGSFHEGEDGDSWVGYDHERSIRLASISVTAKDGPPPTAEELAEAVPLGPDAIGPGDDALRGGAEIRDLEEDGRQFRAMQGVVTADGHTLIVTIVFGDDEGWARDTWRSIRFTADK